MVSSDEFEIAAVEIDCRHQQWSCLAPACEIHSQDVVFQLSGAFVSASVPSMQDIVVGLTRELAILDFSRDFGR